MTVVVGDTAFDDGPQAGFCAREKHAESFTAVVQATDTGRVLAVGPCDSCGTEMTNVLYTP